MTAFNPKAPGQGAGVKWLREHTSHEGAACLIWPFSRQPTGYGSVYFHNRQYYAHRFMCELVHGPAPSKKHYASHLCGNGHGGCVHPRHLKWQTPAQNARDRVAAGNNWQKGDRIKNSKLTRDQAAEILALRGRMSQYKIAAKFGISRESVSHIHCGRMYASLSDQQSDRHG